jgi:hypothetical protein
MKIGSRGNGLLRWLAAGFAVASYLLIFACNSVFIPIPPPDPTFSEGTTPGQWSVSTPPDSRTVDARFYIYNKALGAGLIQKAAPDGSMYAAGLQGQAGDAIEIWWEKSPTQLSLAICRPLGTGLVTQACQ